MSDYSKVEAGWASAYKERKNAYDKANTFYRTTKGVRVV